MAQQSTWESWPILFHCLHRAGQVYLSPIAYRYHPQLCLYLSVQKPAAVKHAFEDASLRSRRARKGIP